MVHTKKLITRLLYVAIGFIFAIAFFQVLSLGGEGLGPSEISHNSFFKVSNNDEYSNDEEQTRDTAAEEEEEEWKLDNENLPNLPVMLGGKKDGPKGFSDNCAKFPNLYKVHFSNIHWQIQDTENETYFFYSAFLDIRGNASSHPHHPYDNAKIRVVGMSDIIKLSQNTSALKHCQLWFEQQKKPVYGNVTEVRMLWSDLWGKNARYYSYIITCAFPPGLKELPVSVSLVPTVCTNATNNLNIFHRDQGLALANSPAWTPARKGFGVCIKALDFPDAKMRDRLIEWIEALRLLGADKIFFYEFFVDPQVKHVLNYYESRGVIQVTQTTLPGDLPNQSQLRHLYIHGHKSDKRLTELVPYNDCLYKNMYEYEFVAVMDTDEIIIPSDLITWAELLEVVKKEDVGLASLQSNPVTTYCFENHYFLDGMLKGKEDAVSEIPPNFHMLRHIYRSANSTGKRYMKCFHSTEATAGVHNHFAFFCRDGKRCRRHYVNVTRAQMNHYRDTCVSDIKNCTTYLATVEEDTKLWRFKDEIMKRVNNVLSHLNG